MFEKLIFLPLIHLFCVFNLFAGKYTDLFLTYLNRDFFEVSNYNSSINGLDKIYVINLDSRIDRSAYMNQLLIMFRLNYEKFSAVNGWDFSTNKLRMFYKHCLVPAVDGYSPSPGQIGVFLSHLSIIKHSLDKGYEVIWILEDDVIFKKDPKLALQAFLCEMKNKKISWDILYTDLNSRFQQPDGTLTYYTIESCFGLNFNYKRMESVDVIEAPFLTTQVKYRLGAYSMLLSKSGMIKIFDYFIKNKMEYAYDVDLNFIQNKRFFQLFEDFVTTIGNFGSNTLSPISE